MQTDNTLGLSNNRFTALEQEELEKAGFTAKPKEVLSTDNTLQFNGCVLVLNANSTMSLYQKEQGKKICAIDMQAEDFR